MSTPRLALTPHAIVFISALALAAPLAWLGCGASTGSGAGDTGGGNNGEDDTGAVDDAGGGGGCATGGPRCAKGSYCDVATDSCKPGCDVNEDCASNYCIQSTHVCEGDEDAGTATDGSTGQDTGPRDAGKTDAGNDGGDTSMGEELGVDAGRKPLSLIIPGIGADYKPDDLSTHELRVGQSDYGSMTTALGASTNPNPDLVWYQSWAPVPIDALFVDSSGDKSLNAGDKLNRLLLMEGFFGGTAQGSGLGSARAQWSGELGAADNSAALDAGETMDFFFKKGLNIVYDGAGLAKNVTIYAPTNVVPGQSIDWNNMTVFGIKASVKSGSSFGAVTGALGQPDLVTQSSGGGVDTTTYTYVALGLTFTHAAEAQTDVNVTAAFSPYFGKLAGTQLGVGSTHAAVKAYFDSKYQERTQTAGQTTIYYYEIKTESIFTYTFGINLGFVYNSKDQVASILVGYPIQK